MFRFAANKLAVGHILFKNQKFKGSSVIMLGSAVGEVRINYISGKPAD